MPLVTLIYVSSAKELFPAEELRALLEISQRNNLRDGITGMLLYKDGNFMQALEGEREVVRAVQARIQRDPRHHGLITLLEKPIAHRRFTDWSMGFQNLADPALLANPGYNPMLGVSLQPEDVQIDPSPALKLLGVFQKKM